MAVLLAALSIVTRSVMTTFRGSRVTWSSVLLWTILCWINLLIAVKGECSHSSRMFKNKTVWQPDLCTVCTCEDPVFLCNPISCQDPRCDYSQGEKLELLPTQCCPVCSQRKAPCDFNGQLVPHGTEWKPSNCETCHCDNGKVFCSSVVCPDDSCRPGDIRQNVSGQCCPRCIPSGRQCVDDTGIRRPDGEVWSPLNCIKCVCRNGHVFCMTARCPNVPCPEFVTNCYQGTKAVEKANQCCPVCEHEGCHLDGHIYKEGELWKNDACTSCTCHHGQVACRSLECSGNITCSQGQVKAHRDGDCCPKCVPKDGTCFDDKKLSHHHGDMWKSGLCEYCGCSYGYVKCRTVRCGKVHCTDGQVLTAVPDQCCPICIYPVTCMHKGYIYQNGQSWHPDICSVCTCVNGEPQCYHVTCPVCSSINAHTDFSADSQQCCPRCEKASNIKNTLLDNQLLDASSDDLQQTALSLSVNQPLVVAAGEATLLTTDVLDVAADAKPENVVFTVLDGPLYGHFIISEEETNIYEFSRQDLLAARIAYRHHGNVSAMTDLARLQVSDGHDRIMVLLSFKVQSQRSRLPVVMTNTGGLLHKGGALKITPDILKSKVHDAEHTKKKDAVYTLVPMKDNPRHGEIIMMVPTPVEGPGTGWTLLGDGMMGSKVVRFMQRDIDEGRIYYKHSGKDFLSDRFTFEVGDTAIPPNVLRDQAFDIKIEDDGPDSSSHPVFVPFTKLELTVMENQIAAITSAQLIFSGPNLAPENLVYKIVTQLWNDHEGSVEHIDFPFKPLQQFTQADINNRQIIYRPPDEDIGDEEKEVNFIFTVGSSGEVKDEPEHKFTIRILPVNNNPPFFVNPNPEVTIPTGGRYSLTSSFLEVSDPDSKLEDLDISFVKTPNNGVVERLGEGIRSLVKSGDKFTYSNIFNSTFQYIHTGGTPTQEEVSLEVSDGLHKTRNVIYLNIIKLDKSIPFVMPSATFQINITEGETQMITGGQISFSDEEDSDNHIQIILVSHTSQGHFQVKRSSGVYNIEPGGSFSQAEVNEGLVSFIADKEIGLKSVSELVFMKVSDSSGNVLPNQIVSLHIMPMDNYPPTITTGSEMQVEEGEEAAFTTEMVSVLDVDSPAAQVMFTVETPPQFGILLNKKSGKDSGMSDVNLVFPFMHLADGYIYYLQSDHQDKEPSHDHFLFSLNDGNNWSPLEIFNISIQLVNDEPPQVVTEQLFVGEGKTVALTNSSVYVVDLDTPPNDLLFTIMDMPRQGSLMKKELNEDPLEETILLHEKSTFSYQDVLNGVVIYSHDGGETDKDSVMFYLTDGEFGDTITVSIIIGLVSDETPRVRINRGLRVQAGSKTVITQHELQASDVDSESSQLVYTVMKDPNFGHLQFDNADTTYTVSALSANKTFQQSDIDNGYISFVHQFGENTGTTLFKFKLADSEGNDLIDQDFFITVIDDHLPPFVVSNKEFLVTEGTQEKLTTKFLSFADPDTDSSNLVYTVMEGPNLGHLELLDQPGVPIMTFTQGNLAANKVIYLHTSSLELTMDQFRFVISDGKNEIVQSFYINIQPVDNAIPVLTNNGLRVQEGIRKFITEFDLKAVDQDTKEHMILFTVVKQPEHGSLDLYTSGSYRTAESFTMEDIYENRISYQHEGSETTHDAFIFLVADGTNKLFTLQHDMPGNQPVGTPQTFAITILLVDDGVPIIERNLGLQYLETKGTEVGSLITSKELSVTDEDTPATDIIYTVTSLPKFGFLENTKHPGKHIKSFTQKDINSAKIRYIMTKKSTSLQDSFDFNVMDTKPNIVPGNRFYILWSEISIGQPFFNITETQRVLQVPLVRRGNLKQYSVVECQTSDDTATSRSDINRPGLHDYILMAEQVQFDSWQSSKTCNVIISDDSVYEGSETFYVQISSPVFTVLGDVRKVAVTVHDEEDKPTLQFLSDVTEVKESDEYAITTIVRSGDVSDSISVVCSTKSQTATGSSLSSLESGSDFISRGHSNAYRVIFHPGVTQANCSVKLIDDSMYESTEQFEVQLSDPSIPATLGALTSSLVIIEGPNDVSHVYLAHDVFAFPENSGTVQFEVLREGSDLSHSTIVWCATRMTSTVSATPGQDYVPSSMQLSFGPGQTSQICRVVLLDDDLEPKLEGNETFTVFLSSAEGSILVQPHSAVVTIYDDHLDIPQMTFSQDSYTTDEKNKTVNATVIRSGDITMESSVICYTQQQTAKVSKDYEERPFNNNSRIFFKNGERIKSCIVNILDDEEFEKTEVFQLRLDSPLGSNGISAILGQLNTATVTITNYDDVSTIQFEHPAYSVHEPSIVDTLAAVKVKIVRSGSLHESTSVRCSTRDGSAQSGSDYNPKSLVLVFLSGVREVEFTVDVLYNTDVEWHQSFKIQLGPEEPTNSVFGHITVATITILDNEVSGSIILPAAPMVVSLLYYDDSEQGLKVNPSPGYPLVCITPCDVQYPDYPVTSSLCEDGGINQTSILYQWEVAAPQGDESFSPLFVRLTDKTPFTSVDSKVLESIYFRPHFQVRCIAQPLQKNGNPGIPLKSRSVTIGINNICKATSFPPSHQFTYQAQSFLARLEYIPPDRVQHPNTVHISVQIPHQDGMLPLISTQPLHNLRFLLSQSVYQQQHVCSNIVTATERPPFLDQGFLVDTHLEEEDGRDQQFHGPGFDFPHQFDEGLRESQSLLIYRHLNLKSCSWKFDAWYHMTELIDLCGGQIVSDFQVMDKSDTHLTIRVPLYVSYVYATAPTGWGSLEHRTEMEVSFYYRTVLWKTGLDTEGGQEGRLQVVRVLIGDDGKLVLEFRTQAKFRGQFVLKHHTLPGVESRIVAPVPLATSIHLELVWSQNTFDSPYQVWKARSQYTLKDYTGIYHVELIPCLASGTQNFIKSDLLPCVAQQPQRFEVPISFQQTNHPVPVIYSLNTEFQLTNNLKTFLLNPATEGMENEDWNFSGIFSKGQRLYGRVLWNPEQDLKAAYTLFIHKVFLCTGRDGYIPTYDPTGETYGHGPQYGCIQPSKTLLHRFIILDRVNPDMANLHFHQVPFNAQFAYENEEYSEVSGMPGVDGFVMDIDPLYKVDSGYQWYLQVMYTIDSTDTTNHRIRRSSVAFSFTSASSLNWHTYPQILTLPSSSSPRTGKQHVRYKRELRKVSNAKNITNEKHKDINPDSNKFNVYENHKNGTNIKHLHLIYDKVVKDSSLSIPFTAIAIPILVSLIVLFIIICICLRKRRRKLRDLAGNVSARQNNMQALKSSQSHRYIFSNSSDTVQESTKQGINKAENRNSVSSVSKLNVIRIKDINIQSQLGKNVQNGTEV